MTGISASVVLCTRDRAHRLPAALEALAAMRVPEHIDWECLIVDNASVDATRQVVEEFIARGHPRFRYVHEPRPGKTFALNSGIAAARGDILAFTDDDALVAPDWLAAIVDAMQGFQADGVGGRVLPLWESPCPKWLTREFWNVLALLDLGDRPFQLSWDRDPRMLYGVNYAFRRSVFEQLGPFNTILGSRGEDQELFDRLAVANARVFYDPRIVVQHMIPAERMTRQYYRDWHRATGLARAKLQAPEGRSLFSIPLYTLRQGAQTLLQWLAAIVRGDGAAAFRYRLRILYYFAFYRGRLRQSS